MNKMKEYQKKALGYTPEEISAPIKQVQQILSIIKLYKNVEEDNLKMGDDGQSFQQFMKMKGVQPNEQGTGRVSFSEIHQIQYFFCLKKERKRKINKNTKQTIQNILKSYLQIPVTEINPELFLSKQLKLEDHLLSIQYEVSSKKLDSNKNLSINALEMLEVILQYKTPDKILLCFVQSSIFQDQCEIYGRACGDGVGVISFMGETSKQMELMLETTIHETLHTLGFDHCLVWSCLMNPLVNGQFWLCPCCIRKILSEINIGLEEWIWSINKGVEIAQFKCLELGRKIEKNIQLPVLPYQNKNRRTTKRLA